MLVRSNPGSAVPLPPFSAPDRAGAPPPGEDPRSVAHAASAAPLRAVASRSAGDPLALSGLPAAIEDARAAALSPADGPPDPTAFTSLRARLAKAGARLPEAYRRAVAEPLLRALDRLGASGLARILREDPDRQAGARLLLDLAQAVLQRGEGHQARATAALQEVVSDLYDGFLSAEDRRGVKPPDHGVLPPLVRWGSAATGPYTWPATATAALGAKAALVSLPAANATGGLLAWPALAHETAGHDILEADDGLRDELARAVRGRLLEAKLPAAVADYWAERIDETAADVLGVLNMGPAAAVGLVGYFRAMNGAAHGRPSLRNVGRPEDPHPADIARAWLAAESVRLLSFAGAGRWADRLVAEADRDLGRVWLGKLEVTPAMAKASAAIVARTIVRTRLAALEGRTLQQIQDWRDRDETIASELRTVLGEDREGEGPRGGPGAAAGAYGQGAYAAHVVAAAVYEAVGGGSSPAQVMERMVGVLAAMHARNPGWQQGPERTPRRGPPAPAPRVA